MASPNVHLDPFAILSKDLTYHEELGHGASGTVHRATLCKDDGTSMEVAAKKIPRATDEKDRIEQGKEVQYLRRLNHPNIIEFYGTVVDSDELVIVTEYASKGSLYDYLRNERNHNRKLPQDQVYDWAIQAAKAIRYLQEMKVAHRDIKSPNFVITAENVLKLCDFGVAKDLSVSVSVDSIKGTYRWMAPEVFKEQRLSPASDLFSYGIVVWEMQAGEVPHKDLTVPEHIIYKVGTANIRPPIPADCPDDIKALIQQCWDEDRGKRPIIDEAIVALCRSQRTGHNYLQECSTQTDVPGTQERGSQTETHESTDVDNPAKACQPSQLDNSTLLKKCKTNKRHKRKLEEVFSQLEALNTDDEFDDISVASEQCGVRILDKRWSLYQELPRGQQMAFPDASCAASCPGGGIAVAVPGHKSIFFIGDDGNLQRVLDFTKVEQQEYKHFRPKLIAITSLGNIFAVGNENRIVLFDAEGKHLHDSNESRSKLITDIAINRSNYLVVLWGEPLSGSIEVYQCFRGADGVRMNHMSSISLDSYVSTGLLIIQFSRIAVTSNSEIFTSITNGEYVDIHGFTFDGQHNMKISPKMREGNEIKALAVDSNNNLYVAFRIHPYNVISQFSGKGVFMSRLLTMSSCVDIRAMTCTESGLLCILSCGVFEKTAVIHVLKCE